VNVKLGRFAGEFAAAYDAAVAVAVVMFGRS
jgi:hypothetical protein